MSPVRLSLFSARRVCFKALAAVLSLALALPSMALAELPPHLQEAYQEVYLAAESLVEQGRLMNAISLYRGSLGELKNDGRVHLRLAQLYEKLKRPSKMPLVAYHYLMCTHDREMQPMMRDMICEREVKRLLSPLSFTGEPLSIEVLRPEAFRGVASQGMLLPKGPILLRVKRRGAQSFEEVSLSLPHSAPLQLGPRSFLPSRPKLSAADLIDTDRPNATPSPSPVSSSTPSGFNPDPFALTEPPQDMNGRSLELPRWPGYTLITAGLAAAGLGTYVFFNVDQFSGNYLGDELPVVILGGAAAALVIGGSWLAISW